MNRAESSANALGEEFVKNMNTALDIVESLVAKGEAQFAILASAKSTFCVGADIDQMYTVTDPAVAVQVPTVGHKLFNRIEQEKFPIVAAINGLALGGGFEMSLACHQRLMASTAKVGFPECLLGLLPGGGGTVRTQRLCGLTKTVQWIMTSKQIKPQEAKSAGACDVIIPADDRWNGEHRFYEGVRKWAGQYLSNKPARLSKRKNISLMDQVLENTTFGRRKVADETIKMLNKKTRGKYIAQYKALECIMYSATHSNQQGFDKECRGFAELLCSPEAKNQMSLYFLQEGMKKSADKTGVPKDKVMPVNRVGVIGAGVMGSGIVHYFAKNNIPVAVKDLTEESVKQGITNVRAEFERAVRRKRMVTAELDGKMALVTGGTTNEVFRDADVIVEAAVEVMDIKKKVIQQLEKDGILHSKSLFATNTSSLSLTEMQTVAKCPHNIVGMHFFNPVSKMPLVEVIKGKSTSTEAAAAIFNLALKTGKIPIIVNDGPGFLVNRILGVYMAEAGRLAVDERCHPACVDEAILAFGMPMGPFRLLDEVGLDVACHVGPVLANGLKSDRFSVSATISQMVADGYLGRKNRKGFYTYAAEGKEAGLNSAVLQKYLGEELSASISETEIVDRCVLLMVNEATRILDEGIAMSPEDVDTGMVWGTGFPPFRGGLLQYADHRGIANVVAALEQLQRKTKRDYFAPTETLKKMAIEGKRFFPTRPYVPYQERHGYPKVTY
ncbi:trifunctional enzyme alpha subunit, mitochondrial precursor-like protein [Leishmania major strain Friedlin]|uniref:Trifunctional enzyme alpha subunit, mitochondrial-like protein n=1 Tax=Leishmania major TaxID=5664 RepID=Q4Q939_LEIMA|nr:trifunctional enzyme alpha subunit, mitochondrial precursor-like protein [Leishmania major strain Friedlin]CAG9576476.1 trifunctional_enzyme_alpha_subunit_-_mitochondrial_precursor-like_protein [Leishmania major strain Friedlin]CAJ05316.1 trifunctional enzyme alpha subunit, mitochondrial precursor-like protein [Leishmania major strain Friedlin]|eukprot:XP_001684159.1 trifunctional enzyme alpha subunit, mitochondrial precursor-like protein [Leishmania major strain Friedlin]